MDVEMTKNDRKLKRYKTGEKKNYYVQGLNKILYGSSIRTTFKVQANKEPRPRGVGEFCRVISRSFDEIKQRSIAESTMPHDSYVLEKTNRIMELSEQELPMWLQGPYGQF